MLYIQHLIMVLIVWNGSYECSFSSFFWIGLSQPSCGVVKWRSKCNQMSTHKNNFQQRLWIVHKNWSVFYRTHTNSNSVLGMHAHTRALLNWIKLKKIKQLIRSFLLFERVLRCGPFEWFHFITTNHLRKETMAAVVHRCSLYAIILFIMSNGSAGPIRKANILIVFVW